MNQNYNDVVNFKNILKSEIKSANSFSGNNKEILQKIIPNAAKKLEPHFENKSKICSILQKVFNQYHPRDIRRYCPQKYKRKYDKPTVQHDPILELFKTMESVGKDIVKIADDLSQNPPQKIDTKLCLELIETTKEYDIQLKLLKDNLDRRRKISPFQQ